MSTFYCPVATWPAAAFLLQWLHAVDALTTADDARMRTMHTSKQRQIGSCFWLKQNVLAFSRLCTAALVRAA